MGLGTDRPDRYVDLALALRRRTTGEILLFAGGQYDTVAGEFTEFDPEHTVVLEIEESQVEFVRWFATWLQAFRDGLPRDTSLTLLGGERRGGKTWIAVVCTIAALIDCPTIDGSATIGWLVSRSYQERDELDRIIQEILPSHWYRHTLAPEHRYTFIHGPSVKNVSADDAESLKRGRCDIATVNEAQKLPIAVLSNLIGGVQDKDGIAILTANPPRRAVGEWVLSLKEAIGDKKISGAKYFGFSAKDNTQIVTDARRRVGEILRQLDPRAALADDEGAWLPVGERAYPKFDAKKHLAEFNFVGVSDITGDVTARKGRRFSTVAGCDFQGTPHQAMVAVKVVDIGNPDGPVYWFVDEAVVDEATEDDLIDAIEELAYTPESLKVVADASGSWQLSDRSQKGRGSFDVFKSRRYHIEAPRQKKTDRGLHAKNPAIEDRLGLWIRLCEQDRIRVDPERCPKLAEALKECPLKSINGHRKPYGRYSHITDAAGYALYWLVPPPRPVRAAVDPRKWLSPTPFRASPI